MTLGYERKRLADFVAAARLSRELTEQERWPRERLERDQQERLDALVRHATEHSHFYRERIGPRRGPVELSRLPVLDKATMMDRFDEVVTDPRLRRDEAAAHVEALGRGRSAPGAIPGDDHQRVVGPQGPVRL